MCKTAPTSLKQMIESDLEKTLILFWVILPITIFSVGYYGIGFGVFAFLTLVLGSIFINFRINKNKVEHEGFLGLLVPNIHRNKNRILEFSLLIGVPLSGKWELSGGLELIFSALNDFHEFKLGSNTPKNSSSIRIYLCTNWKPRSIL